MNKSTGNFKPKSNIPAFLLKTYDILENTAHFDIISWNKEGTAFVVKNVNEFSEKVLPKYFKHNNFSSFVRQLNMYDFHKSKQDSKENEFKHKLFRRGQKHLLAEIKRKGSENHAYVEEPIMSGESSVPRKNPHYINEELNAVKIQQEELGKVGKMIYSQNTQLLNENKLLWNELTKNKEKYEKKIEKLMMFVSSIMGKGADALGNLPDKKMLPFSDSADVVQETSIISPNSQQKENFLTSTPNNKEGSSPSSQDKKSEDQFGSSNESNEAKLKSPPIMNTPVSNGSTLPNTPNMGPMTAPALFNFSAAPQIANPLYVPQACASPMIPLHNMYSAQPYFGENTTLSPPTHYNSTTTGKDNIKIGRAAPNMDSTEAKEFKENPTKMVKKDTDSYLPGQNPLQVWNLPSIPGMNESFKLDDYALPLSLSRGPSFTGGELDFSRLNTYNVPRVPNSLEANFAQWPMYIQNLQSNDNYGLGINKLESEGLPKFDMLNENGIPTISPIAFARNPSGFGGYTFGQACEDYRNKH